PCSQTQACVIVDCRTLTLAQNLADSFTKAQGGRARLVRRSPDEQATAAGIAATHQTGVSRYGPRSRAKFDIIPARPWKHRPFILPPADSTSQKWTTFTPEI
ncbi:hypothetical protein CLAIMM_13668, partial [Cladophialophora immunda]